jgi:hypothetical protein
LGCAIFLQSTGKGLIYQAAQVFSLFQESCAGPSGGQNAAGAGCYLKANNN